MSIRRLNFILFFTLILVACGSGEETAVSDLSTAAPIPTVPTPELATSTPSSLDTPNAESSPATDSLPSATPTDIPHDLSIDASQIFLYPVPQIYDGDLVTFQVLAYVPEYLRADSVLVHIWVDDQLVVQDIIGSRNLSNDAIGLYEWAWDTTGQIGDHLITVILDPDDTIQQGDENPDNNQASFTARVEDSSLLSNGEQNATWVVAETNCCIVHVVSETAAYRDLSFLLNEVENAFQQAAAALTEQPTKKYDVYLINRVIGQGGYAGPSMVVSYLDRHYASAGLSEVLIHEATHLLDRQFAPQRITFLAEGVAVWTSGGHFKPENIDQRAAALVQIDQYVPLQILIDDFYPVQHEIGYLEAAGFVSYLTKIYGWTQFKAFYADVTRDDGATLSEAVDVNLQAYFGVTLAQAEADWLDYLAQLPYNPTENGDLQTSIRFYDTMRWYQRMYDPTAYFLTAWLPYPQELEALGNPADVSRHSNEEINVTLEVMLKASDLAIRTGDFARANAHLDSIERVLSNNGVFIDPLATSYLSVVQTTSAQGYIVQNVDLNGDFATVTATKPGQIVLEELSLSLNGMEWILSD